MSEGRRLKAQMVLKGLSLRDVSDRSGVPYATCSQILNGRLTHQVYFRRIRAAITDSPHIAATA